MCEQAALNFSVSVKHGTIISPGDVLHWASASWVKKTNGDVRLHWYPYASDSATNRCTNIHKQVVYLGIEILVSQIPCNKETSVSGLLHSSKCGQFAFGFFFNLKKV